MMAEVAASIPMPAPRFKIRAAASRATSSAWRQAREAIGPDKLLLVDINGAYTPDTAPRMRARTIAKTVRHPLDRADAAAAARRDLKGYASSCGARSPIPLAAGEAPSYGA